ncbi:MAG TPA: tetratricopeptide repeat protein, partial [Spirochaetota bacterium]|nr:tetratricopeptide repeat protein [Spirochaetota bacterium]
MRTIRYVIAIILMCTAGNIFAVNSQAFFEQGMEAFKSGNYKNAELLFRKCVDADDANNDKAWFYLSRSIYSQKRYKDAIFEFNRFLLNCRSNDLCTESRFWIAESQNALSAYIKAIEEYKRFMTMVDDRENPLVSVAHERIGDIYYNQNRLDEAIIEWKSAVQKVTDRDDRKSALIMKLARALIANMQFDEADDMITPLAGDKDVAIAAESNLYLGRVNCSRGKYRNAVKFFLKIPENLRVNQPFSDMYYYLAISYSELGEKENMMNSLQTFVGIAKTSPVYYDGAFLLAKIN